MTKDKKDEIIKSMTDKEKEIAINAIKQYRKGKCKHKWIYDPTGMQRVCEVCGRHEISTTEVAGIGWRRIK